MKLKLWQKVWIDGLVIAFLSGTAPLVVTSMLNVPNSFVVVAAFAYIPILLLLIVSYLVRTYLNSNPGE